MNQEGSKQEGKSKAGEIQTSITVLSIAVEKINRTLNIMEGIGEIEKKEVVSEDELTKGWSTLFVLNETPSILKQIANEINIINDRILDLI